MSFDPLRAPKPAVVAAHLGGAAACAFISYWSFRYGVPHAGWFWSAMGTTYLGVMGIRLLRNMF